MNKIIPIFNPSITMCWCCPCMVDSRVTSFHQRNDTMKIESKIIEVNVSIFLLNAEVVAIVKFQARMALEIGQGLKETMWNGWNLFIIKIFRYGKV